MNQIVLGKFVTLKFGYEFDERPWDKGDIDMICGWNMDAIHEIWMRIEQKIWDLL